MGTSRPSTGLIGLLAAVGIFAILWVTVIHSGSSSSSGNTGLGAYQGAINAAHAAVTTANESGVKNAPTSIASVTTANARPATASSVKTSATTKAAAKPKTAVKVKAVATAKAKPAKAVTAAKHRAQTPAQRESIVLNARKSHKVLAVLFYNPNGPVDGEVMHELATVPLHSSRLVSIAVPINELARYSAITSQVPVTIAPTLVIVNAQDQASTITGFTDSYEIQQRLVDALAVQG